MSTLLMMVLALFTAFLFARYNKSNKLFWIATTSLLLAFTATSIAKNSNKRESKKDFNQMTHIQVPSSLSDTLVIYVTDNTCMETLNAQTLPPVGYVSSVSNKVLFTPSEYYGDIRDQPPQTKSIQK